MNKEFYEDARKVAESCSKERLVELYLAEVQTCCELKEQVQILEEHKEIIDHTLEMYAEKCKKYEEQLANAIVPKFKIGQEVFYIVDKYSPILSGEILEIQIWDLKKDNIVYVIEYCGNVWCESAVFATEEEARKRQEELKGE